MVISEKIQKELNDQLQRELYSAYLYLSMATYFDDENLKGFSNWMKVQAKEEVGHAMRFYNFIYERGGTVKLQKIEEPPKNWNSPLEVFMAAYEHEKKMTEHINRIYELAKSEKDYATESMLKWFIDEQVEEEDQTLEIVKLLEKAKDHINAIFMIDSKLGQRKE